MLFLLLGLDRALLFRSFLLEKKPDEVISSGCKGKRKRSIIYCNVLSRL